MAFLLRLQDGSGFDPVLGRKRHGPCRKRKILTAICQKSLPDAPWLTPVGRKLPGVQPLDMASWVVVDDAYGAQMQERTRLLSEQFDEVLMQEDAARPAIDELFHFILDHLSLRPEFQLTDTRCTRPDGVVVPLDPAHPMETLCQLICEDLCVLEKRGDEHVLTAGLLCFPSSWSLAEKFGRPLLAIHDPVPSYTNDIGRRVQRLFDAVQPGRPLWRANALRYTDPTLFQPRPSTQRRDHAEAELHGGYIRSERQCILRLPQTDAVVFSIQNRVVRMEDLTPEQAAGLAEHPIHHDVDLPA